MFIYGKFIKLINCLCLTHVLFTPYFALIPPFLRNTYRIKQTNFNFFDLLNFSSAKRFVLYYAACLSVGFSGRLFRFPRRFNFRKAVFGEFHGYVFKRHRKRCVAAVSV